MRRTVELRTIVLVVMAVAFGGVTARVLNAAQPTGSSDVLAALLTEVKGLRAAIEQMSTASGRIQLSVARLQIEEQRINEAGKRLQDVRQKLGDFRRELQNNEQRAAGLEERLAGGNGKDEERKQWSEMIADLKRDRVRLRGTVSELAGEEAQMAQEIAGEQTRWVDISRRLDELDASMAIRK